MKLELKFLASKVSRRLFFLFVIAAIIPVTVTGIFSYKYVSSLLIEQKQEHLAAASKNYGMAVYDRILNADEIFSGLVQDIQSNKAEDLASSNETSILLGSTVPIFTDTEIYLLPTNSSSTDVKHLLTGNSKITVSRYNNSLNIYFSKLLTDGTRLLSAKIDINYLFGDLDILPNNENACIVVKNKGTLFCSDAALYTVSKDVFENNINSNSSLNDSTYSTEYIFSSWELYLNGKFNTDGWYIVYTAPNKTFSAPIKSFATAFLPVLLFVILLVSLISLNQIARILTPLSKLTRITESISKGDFSNKITLKSNDEFQELGESFNKMTSELAKLFSDISAMSELDRTILSTMDPKSAFHPVFKHLNNCFKSDFSGIIVMDSQHSDVGYLYNYDKSSNEVLTKGSVQISAEDQSIYLKILTHIFQ